MRRQLLKLMLPAEAARSMVFYRRTALELARPTRATNRRAAACASSRR